MNKALDVNIRNINSAADLKDALGEQKFLQNDYESAVHFFKEAFDIRKRTSGAANYKASLSAFNAGKCLHYLDKIEAALYFYNIFEHSILSSPKLSLLTKESVIMLQTIAWALYQDKYFDASRHYYKVALWSSKKVFGIKHEIVARILNQFGHLSFDSGNFVMALKCFHTGLHMENALLREDHSSASPVPHILQENVLTTYFNISFAYEKIGRLEDSLENFNLIRSELQSINIKKRVDARLHRKTATNVLFNIARIQKQMNEMDSALATLYHILQHLYQQNEEADDSPNESQFVASLQHSTSVTLNEIGIIYFKQGRISLALKKFEESFSIIKILKDYPSCRHSFHSSSVLLNRARCYLLAKGEGVSKALECFKELVNLESARKLKELSWHSLQISTKFLVSACEEMAHIFLFHLRDARKALTCYQKGIMFLIQERERLRTVPFEVRSRFLRKAGQLCFQLGDIERTIIFYSGAMESDILLVGQEKDHTSNVVAFQVTMISFMKYLQQSTDTNFFLKKSNSAPAA